MNVTRLFCCATFISVYLVPTTTDTTSRTTSLTFDRQRHVLSMCSILCRHSYSCTGVKPVMSELKCYIHGYSQRTYYFNCSRDKETLSGYIEYWSKKKGLRQQKGTEEKQCKGRRMLYTVGVVTGRLNGAGTTCDIYLILNGTEGTITKKLQKKGFAFAKGSTGHFEFLAKCVGKLRNIKVKIVKKGIIPSWGWYLDAMTVSVTGGNYTDKYFTNPKSWLGMFTTTQSMEISDLEFTHI